MTACLEKSFANLFYSKVENVIYSKCLGYLAHIDSCDKPTVTDKNVALFASNFVELRNKIWFLTKAASRLDYDKDGLVKKLTSSLDERQKKNLCERIKKFEILFIDKCGFSIDDVVVYNAIEHKSK